jgi:hypothetical protein
MFKQNEEGRSLLAEPMNQDSSQFNGVVPERKVDAWLIINDTLLF